MKKLKFGIQKCLFSVIMLSTFLLVACNEDHEIFSMEEPQEWQPQTFKLSTQSVPGAAAGEEITLLNAYLFVDGTLQKIYNNIEVTQGDNYTLHAGWGSTIYFLANLPETSDLRAMKEGETTLNTFLSLTTETSAQDDATMFFTGSCRVPERMNASQIELNVPLLRSLARFDLDTSYDPQIKVKRIVVTETSAYTTLFPQNPPLSSDEKKEYELKYDTAIGSMEDILQVYESSTPVNITVYADYLGVPTIVRLATPQLKRNFKYTIQLSGLGANITGTLQVLPWEDGGIVETLPDGIGQVALLKKYSVLPAGVQMNEATRKMDISEMGGEMILAFASDKTVELESADGMNGLVTVVPDGTLDDDGLVISRFRVNVTPQGKGRLGYQVVLRMRRASQQYGYDEFYLNVSGSSHQIPEVTIGGVTWMAFNAIDRNLENQTYTLEGETVEDAYRLRWGETLGKQFQWGRLYGYTPWASNTHNSGNQAPDTPVWTSDTHVPCPPGYRLPNKQEMRALLPSGYTLPGEYTYNGERIKAELVNAVPLDIKLGNVTGRARYLKLTSDTGAVLILPLGGQKSDKSPSENPSFGAGFGLWTIDMKGAYGGHAWTGFFWPGIYNTNATLGESQLPTEAFTYARCLKKEVR